MAPAAREFGPLRPTEEAKMDPLTIGIVVAVVSWIVLTLLVAAVRSVWRLVVQILWLLARALGR